MTGNPVFVAIDTADPMRAHDLVTATVGHVGGIKLGLQFFCAQGPAGVRRTAAGQRLFLDLKLHDIPNTVAAAVREVAALAPELLTIHAAGGAAMMKAARAAAEATSDGGRRLRLIGVTVLTSFDEQDVETTGQRGPLGDQALRLAALAQSSGLDGAVCSAHEVALLRAECGPDFILVVPGIRPEGDAAADDQKRIVTPRQALAAGATHLVIGRPITAAADPAAAARAIAAGLGA